MGEWLGVVVAACLLGTATAGWGFVWPQTACRIKCMNGGVCTFNYDQPIEHRCECLIGVWEGERCQWKVGQPHTDEYLEEERKIIEIEKEKKPSKDDNEETEMRGKDQKSSLESDKRQEPQQIIPKVDSEEERQRLIESQREAHRLKWEEDRKKAEEARLEEIMRREKEKKKQDEERERRRKEWEEKVSRHKEAEEMRKREEELTRRKGHEQREQLQNQARNRVEAERSRQDEENRRRLQERERQEKNRIEEEERNQKEKQRVEEERLREINKNRRPELSSTEERTLDQIETSKPPLVEEEPVWDEYREDDGKGKIESNQGQKKITDHLYDDTHLEEYEVVSKEENEYRQDETEEEKMRRMEDEEKRREEERRIASMEKHEHQDFQKEVVNEERDKSFNDDYWDHTPLNEEDEENIPQTTTQETNALDGGEGLGDMDTDSWMMARRGVETEDSSPSLFFSSAIHFILHLCFHSLLILLI